MHRQSDRLQRQTRCEGMRIKREIQMGASGGGQSIKASGHWPREQAGHKPATGTTIPSQNALDPRRASTQVPSSEESCKLSVPKRRSEDRREAVADRNRLRRRRDGGRGVIAASG